VLVGVACGTGICLVGLGERGSNGCCGVTLVVPSEVGRTQPPKEQPWMVMGLGMCIQNRGLRGSGLEGPMQDTALDWIPYPHGSEHWISKISK